MKGADPTSDVFRMARAALEPCLGELVAREAGARAGSEDDLHDMRVASRRARAALDAFGPVLRRRPLAAGARAMKAVTAALGAAREWDVHLAALEKERARAAAADERAALDLALGRFRARRAREHARMRDGLDGARIAALAPALLGLAARGRASRGGAGSLDALAREVIVARARRAWGLAERRRDEEDPDRLHRVRIAMKKLRYALEALAPAFEGARAGGRDRVREEAKAIQDVLGKHHDRTLLGRLLEAERARLEAIGLAALAAGLRPAIDRLRAAERRHLGDFRALVGERTRAAVLADLGLAG